MRSVLCMGCEFNIGRKCTVQTIHFRWRLFFRRSRKLNVNLRVARAKEKEKKRFFFSFVAIVTKNCEFIFSSFSHAFVHFVYTHQFRSTQEKSTGFLVQEKTIWKCASVIGALFIALFSLSCVWSVCGLLLLLLSPLRLRSCVERVRCGPQFIYWIDSPTYN